MPSAVVIAYRVLTDGLLFSVSIWEISDADTPISRASPRTLMSRRRRSARSRAPMGGTPGDPTTINSFGRCRV
jgi:hypothetical protein